MRINDLEDGNEVGVSYKEAVEGAAVASPLMGENFSPTSTVISGKSYEIFCVGRSRVWVAEEGEEMRNENQHNSRCCGPNRSSEASLESNKYVE